MTEEDNARRTLLAAGLAAMLPACQADTTARPPGASTGTSPGNISQEPRTMATENTTGRKVPEPPASTQALREHVDRAMLNLSIVYTHQPDRDFATLLAAHRKGLLDLAQIELKHGSDPEMRATAQRIVDAHAAEDTALQAWRKRQGN